jgi:uncharacterized repeat protein (TIGR02543 family)
LEAQPAKRWNFEKDLVPDTSITLFSKWAIDTFTVSFNSNGGTRVSPKKVICGDKVDEPDIPPTRYGYDFNGWYLNIDTDLPVVLPPWDFNNDIVTRNITLFASWLPKTYNITYQLDNWGFGNLEWKTYSTGAAKYGETIYAPAAPYLEGYIFIGWSKNINFISLWNFATDIVVSDTILYSKFEPNIYTVSFESNGGTYISPKLNVSHGSRIDAPNPPTRIGYDFAGWLLSTEPPVDTREWDFNNDEVTSNITLYANWRINEYKVEFIGYTIYISTPPGGQGGGSLTQTPSIMATQFINYGEKAERIEEKLGMCHYQCGTCYLADWRKEEGGVWNFKTDIVTSDIKLYPIWGTYYIVYLHSPGVFSWRELVKPGEKIARPLDPTNDDCVTGWWDTDNGVIRPPYSCVFAGWYKDEALTIPWNFEDYVTENMVLFAKWEYPVYD